MFHGWNHLTAEDREAILRGIADGEVHGGPFHLELDWVDKCNARCFFCNSAFLHNGRSLDWPRAEALLEEARAMGLRSLRLSGGGEPTLHPRLGDLLAWLERSGVVLDQVTTNGLRLGEPLLGALGRLRVGIFNVSLNYATPETWAEGSMGLPARNFDRVVEGLRALAEVRRGNPRFETLAIQFFVHRLTLTHIERMYRLARELGADAIAFLELHGIEESRQFSEADLPTLVERFRPVCRDDWDSGRVWVKLVSRGAAAAFERMFAGLEREMGRPRSGPSAFNPRIRFDIRYCYIPWYSLTISGSQAVFPCCFLLNKPTLPPLDDLAERSLAEVWRGAAFRELRRELRAFFLYGAPLPDPAARLRRTDASCHDHQTCPVTAWMCDDEFYEEAERRLAAERRRPEIAQWIAGVRAGRQPELP